MRYIAITALATTFIHAQTQTPPPQSSSQLTVSVPETATKTPQAVNKSVLSEGTPVRMRINRTVSSSDAHGNDNVDFETLDDVTLGDVVVIPKGSTAIATITEAVPKRRMARGGKLSMNIDYVRAESKYPVSFVGSMMEFDVMDLNGRRLVFAQPIPA